MNRRPPKPNWLSESLMNLLVDYYPEVPFRPYGSGSTLEVPRLRIHACLVVVGG